VAEEGVDVLPLEVDVRDETAVRSAFARTADRFGRVDILANNAGVWSSRPFHELDGETWDAVVETNLKGAWVPTKYAVPIMRTGPNRGRIITTASVAGRVGTAGSGHYAAAMHGVVGLTKTLALELAVDGITVNAVCPTGVDTPMITGMLEAAGLAALERISDLAGPMNVIDEQLLEPRDIAEAYLWLSSDAARYVTGTALPIDAGMTMK
jgi:NAD(P)-dependent dehydrogenase (short-subunit alcohol dehydrogenase family)